jgi:putative ATP-dependent endonuclease of the OLD family
MRIKTVQIENFRSIQNQTIFFNQYTCFVGANGAGKSTVLAALNIFFQERTSMATDVAKLADEDYFRKNTETPIRISVTFDDLGRAATEALAAYVRGGELTVTAEASFNAGDGFGAVRHYGQRLGLKRSGASLTQRSLERVP